MPVEIAGWTVDGDGATPQRLVTGQLDLERHLENWITRDPSLIEDGFLVVGRQLRLDGGPLDLLCLDAQGGLHVVEIKRDTLYRDTIAQAIDYAASLSVMPADALAQSLQKYLRDNPNPLAEARLREQARLDLPDEGRRRIGIVLVGTRRDSSLDRVADFLGDGYGVPIRVVTFQVLDLRDGRKLLVREATEGEHLPESPRGSVAYSWETVLANAERAGVGAEMKTVYTAAEALGLYPRPSKVSLMLTPMSDKRRYLFTFWPKGTTGQIGMIYSVPGLAEFHNVPEAAALDVLGAQPRYLSPPELPAVLEKIKTLLQERGPTDGPDGGAN